MSHMQMNKFMRLISRVSAMLHVLLDSRVVRTGRASWEHNNLQGLVTRVVKK